MPLTTPPGASAPAYARNRLTGEIYSVGSNVKSIDDLNDVDTSTTGPTGGSALIWDDTVSQWVPGVASTVAALDDLTDVDLATVAPFTGDALVFDGTNWIPGVASTVESIDDLTDVDTTTYPPVPGQGLVFDGATWVPGAASIGGAGPTGPTGPQGVSTIIIGDFGAQQVPGGLPPDGLIPINWDGMGKPAVAYQVNEGESLYYDRKSDPTLDGHLYQYVTTAVVPEGWIDVGLIQGPIGHMGPTGPTGPAGPEADEFFIGPDDPSVAQPTAELWFDTDDPTILGPADMPPGGLVGNPLVKASDVDGDSTWIGSNGSVVIGDNAGYTTAGGGGLFKKSGAGVVLRKHSANTNIRIENNDGSGGQDIVTVNGNQDIQANSINFGTDTGQKIIMWDGGSGPDFGIALESGELRNYVSSNTNVFTWRVGGHGGTEVARITQSNTTIPPLVATNHSVSWLNGFSGTMAFRVNAACVTLQLHDVRRNVATAENIAVKICAYPSGVPAPWATLRMAAHVVDGLGWYEHSWVEARGDGIYLQAFDNRPVETVEEISCSLFWTR